KNDRRPPLFRAQPTTWSELGSPLKMAVGRQPILDHIRG
ncbi:MAG: hypothetical protein ACJAVJ_001324, partial [Planctomycetota bacterium]